MENLEEDLTCPVCYSLFIDPRVLPCSHTFCKACLDNVLQLSTNFSIWRPLRLPLKCPNCRSMVELPPTGVEALPVNVCLRAIIEKYQRDSEPRAPSCPEHDRQPLNVYCVQDRKLICGLCLTVGQHQGHAIDDLQTAYVKERHAPSRLVEQLTDQRWDDVCALVERLEQEKSRREALIKEDRDAVARHFQELERILEQKKEAFMAVLDKASSQVVCAYKPLIDKLKDMKQEQLELVAIISSISEQESALEFLENVHHLRERVDALTQTELPEVPTLHISPRVEEFLEEHWADVALGRLEDGPIPQISCFIKRRSSNESRTSKSGTFLLAAVLTASLLLLLFHWDPASGQALAFNISDVSRALTRLTHELSSTLHGSVAFLYSLLHDLGLNLRSCLSAVGESTYQHAAVVLKTLRLC